jgi:formylglycine-generating enzyme required for sulfatase activity
MFRRWCWPLFSLAAAVSCAPSTQPPPKDATAEAGRPAKKAITSVPANRESPAGKMAHVPEATYPMGSEIGEPDERPVHEVHVAAFQMDLTEVTVGQYAKCVKAGGCTAVPTTVHYPGVTKEDQQIYDSECNDDRADRQEHAENCVDWSMADTYCRWAGERLPTEEEWEYAACGGNCDKQQPAKGNAALSILGSERWPFTSQVALSQPGAFGLYDMAGNVWEWTASAYCPYDHPGCVDGRKVVRGGSWSVVDFLFVRLTDRSPSDPTTRNTNLGFRCAKSG